ncbi:MAG: hypothetical protein Q7T20_03160 [Saprospiraceae bacterium]|nr:hypothetical protein [Saprospiraceae bacterium]
MKSFFSAFFFFSLAHTLLAQDTIRFQLCAELWKDNRPIIGATVVFQPYNPAFPYPPIVFTVDTSQFCAAMTVVLSDYLPGTTFSYRASVPDTGFLNGVSVVDLCKIGQHIMGINPLPSPFALIAADANKSGSVTTFDLIELRKLILGVYNTLPNNTSWRFITDYCVFQNPANPFQGNCQSEISSAELAALDGGIARVLGIKTGDVDGDVRFDGEPYVPPVVTDSITMLLPQGLLSAGIPVAIPVKFDKDFTLGSLQVKFFIDPALARYDSISDGLMDVNSTTFAHYDSLTGRLIFTASGYFDFLAQAGVPLFYLHLTPLQSVNLTTVLNVAHDDPSVRTFAIGSDCALYYTIGSTYSGFVSSPMPELRGLRVGQPSPNPFGDRTCLEIELESSEWAVLEIFDLTGRLQFSEEKLLDVGVSSWEIPASALSSGSLGIWRLRVGGQMMAGKLAKK